MKKQIIPHLHLDIRHMHPDLLGAWIGGIGLAFVGILAVTLAAVLLFIGVFDADVVREDVSSDVGTINRGDLFRSVKIIDGRVADFERIMATAPALSDPSR